jgi:eukaryotic-like serine/threonine-protein kinase
VGHGDTIALTAKRCKLCGQRFTNDAAFCPFDGEPLEDAPNALAQPEDPLIGKILDGRYEVQSSLGEGGMGTVYQVQHRALQRPFAMKVLRRDLAREAELCTRFIQEARTAATINHPNVIQITDFGNLPEGTPYFVMEYLDGQPLSSLIKNGGPLPAARAVRLLIQVAAGIGAAHQAGIVHRDLKPDNIFVLAGAQSEDLVKLLDFGVAKVAGSAKLTRTGMVFGSPHYMSPEQASGQPVDHRADIYALGVVMYELFTGRVPFEADTFMGVLTKHMFMAPERFVEAMGATKELGALEDITLRCLEKKPENRYSTIEELIAEVEEVVQLGTGDQLEVRPSRVSYTPRPSADFRLADELELPAADEIQAARVRRSKQDSRYRWAVLAVGGAGLLLLASVVALVLVRNQSETGPIAATESASSISAPRPAIVAPAEAPSAHVSDPPDADAPDAAVEKEAEAPPPPKPPAVHATATRRNPASTRTAAPAQTTKPPSTTSEIVNPWAN